MIRILLAAIACLAFLFTSADRASAYPAYAQAAYDNPREATGKIVCANCHLAEKPTRLELPQAVTPGKVFQAKVEIPYDTSVQQVTGDGSLGGLNVGAVVVLPEGFRLATEAEMGPKLYEETADLYIQPFNEERPNILVVGPISGEDHQEIVFPVMTPDPAEDDSVAFMKYLVSAGGNRGRGQINPDGSISNNNQVKASAAGTISAITEVPDPFDPPVAAAVDRVDLSPYYTPLSIVTIDTAEGLVDEIILAGPQLLVSVGDRVEVGTVLTNNPNVGGFGQADREIVLQNPTRVKWLIAFLAAVALAQILLVLKKKQIEKIQLAEGLV
ncbi:apocytochrome f [Synechococcus sp. PCC 7336]|uniref:apocytochrome f n=1 Tax=Synechococcus sp. PCC 7336 TaxID=195250 RepID=UPI00034A7E46|nr:apocytochrome f [Synechococcus sp. PCC 7336]